MRLKSFLKFNNISQKKFSKFLGISPVSLTRYITGERFPEKKILSKIYKFSDGVVTPNDFLLLEPLEDNLTNDDKDLVNNLIKNIRKGSRRHLAKAITLIESSLSKDRMAADYMIEKLKSDKESIRIGITGVPGVGKSTFIESFGMNLIDKGFKVAVLAVDPSSKKTGGSILGDKTRMEKLSVNLNAFIRPTPSDGYLGGVARKTRESILCLEEYGFNIIFVETMGVGQAEIDVYDMVDIFLVLLLPSGGDELQGIKKGIIEVADVIIVNKADNELAGTAELTVRDYKSALGILKNQRDDVESRQVFKCSSLNCIGFSEIWEFIINFINLRKKNDSFYENRELQKLKWMWETLNQKTNEFINKDLKKKEFVRLVVEKLKKNSISTSLASKLIFEYISRK